MTIRLLLGALLCAIVAPLPAGTPTYAIDAHVVGAGSSVRASSACFALNAVIAEPVAGFSTGGVYTMRAGFDGPRRLPNDTLFAAGFEDCPR